MSDEKKTHKNPNLRAQAPVPAGPKPYCPPAPRPTATAASTLPPVLELDGKKWKVVSDKPKPQMMKMCGGLWRRIPDPVACSTDVLRRRTRREQRTW